MPSRLLASRDLFAFVGDWGGVDATDGVGDHDSKAEKLELSDTQVEELLDDLGCDVRDEEDLTGEDG